MTSRETKRKSAFVDRSELLRKFVRLHQGGTTQRGPKWYKLMEETVGGSQIAAVMGTNPYMTFEDVVASLLGVKKWDGGSVACWWGSLFEDVSARVVELDCGTAVLGDEICIQLIPGHRNSPDGYCVISLYLDSEGELQIWTTDCGVAPVLQILVMLEIKSPYRRVPNGKVVPYYRPQIWSGLSVSPVAEMGLFIDAAFRKCSIADLGANVRCDTEYHGPVPWSAPPYAWGLTAIYAPQMSAPLFIRLVVPETAVAVGSPSPTRGATGGYDSQVSDQDFSIEAWAVHSQYFGISMKGNDSNSAHDDLVDFGDCAPRLFDRVMKLIDGKKFPTLHSDPCFGDGRGLDLHTGRAIGKEIDRLRAEAPAHHFLLGVIPWKLFEIHYVPEGRKYGFIHQIERLVADVQHTVALARASGDPEQYLAKHRAARGAKGAKKERGPPRASTADDVQDLFDSL